MELKLLSLILWLPVIGAFAVVVFHQSFAKQIALVTCALTLLPIGLMIGAFDTSNAELQFVEFAPWLPAFGISYIVGVDGISFPMVVLTGLLSFLCVIASWNIDKQEKGYFSLFLLLQAAMTGVFVAVDLFMFYVFWELMLLPMYFLVGIWGAPSRVEMDGRTRGGPYAAIKFFLYTLVGSLLMLVAILWLWNHSATVGGGVRTFDLREYGAFAEVISIRVQVILWALFFVAFAVKIPMFPFHTWLPDAHVEAPTAVSVILAGVLLKMGTYGILRVNYLVLPGATMKMAVVVAIFGVINILYGALCAMSQNDMKRLVAYSSISHMGFVMLGMSAIFMTGDSSRIITTGIQGAVLQMWNHGTITAMLFLLVGVIYDRAHHRDIDRLGGLAKTMPTYTCFVAFAFFASLGLPGLSGFIGEAFVLFGSWQAGGYFRVMVLLTALGIIITAAYHLWMIQRVALGEASQRVNFPDISFREIVTLAPLAAIVLWIGVYPAPMLNILNATLEKVVRDVVQAAL